MKKRILIPLFLVGMSLTMLQTRDALVANAEFFTKYPDRASYIAAGSNLNNQICDEGFTLLKNRESFLPMTGTEMVSVFGKSSTSLVYGGGGSGSGHVAGETQIDLQRSLTDCGFTLNPKLTAFYKDNSKSGSGRTNGNSGWKGDSEVTIGETPWSSYTDDIKSSFAEYNDAAIMVISREGSEGCDVLTIDASDTVKKGYSNKHALQLSDNEQDLFDHLKESFDNIIILINSGNIFQCDQFENDDQVAAVLWMGTPGATGASAVGRILSGQVNPSGHTVDTWTRDFTKDPSYQNFSDNKQTNDTTDASGNPKHAAQDTMFNPDGTPVRSDGTYKGEPKYADEKNQVVAGGLNGVKPSSYVSYEEGVYLDYRYYETKYADMAATDEAAAKEWYDSDEGVIYPFGYGLSYTKFEQKIVSSNVTSKTVSNKDLLIKVKVNVKNVGDVAGKDVIQLYWKAPYFNGEIEKSYEVLCAFDKTDVIEPGKNKTYELEFYLSDVANYDFSDANNNGFKGYELDGGKYSISANKSAHEVYDAIEFKVANEGIKFEYDRVTGYKVENRFSGNDFYSSLPLENDVEFTQFSRANFSETFPHFPTIEDRTLKEGSRVEEFYNHKFSIADIDALENYEYVPEAAHKTKEDIEKLGWTQAEVTLSKEESIQFSEMVGIPMDDPKWDEFMNQMTYDEMIKFVTGGSAHNPAISRMDKPGTGDSDGPSQFQIIWWTGAPIVAATYNVELAKEQGEMVGFEGKLSGTWGWAGPACNLHRSPFGGRNFEYYSADPFLSGRMCGRVVAGATDKGVYCFFKHFAVNDQEKNREGVTVYLTEQALRECYLKPFEMSVKEGKSMGIMSSYNRLGLMETAASYPLLTEVLRNEWGFKGSIISDMTHRSNSAFDGKCYENINNRVLSGCNNQLDSQNYTPDINCTWSKEKHCPVFTYEGSEYESYSWWYAVRNCAKESIWMCANSGVMVKQYTTEAVGVQLSNVVDGCCTIKKGENVNIKVTLPEELKVGATYDGKQILGVEASIDEVTPLPDGLTFDGSAIKGVAEKEYNGYIHILFNVDVGDPEPLALGLSFELFITDNLTLAPGVDDQADLPIGAIIGIAGGAVVAIAAVVTVVLLRKKKKVA